MILTATRARRAFSLIELVVVIVILGVIATIAIPRVSNGAVRAAESGLKQDLAVLRNAIEMYRAEHEGNPPPLSAMPDALLEFSSLDHATQATQDATHLYGPYLTAIPPLKIGTNKGRNNIAASSVGTAAWHYDEATGSIVANAAGADAAGVDYATY